MRDRKTLLQVLLFVALVLSLIVPAWVAGASGTVRQLDKCPASYSAAGSLGVTLALAPSMPSGSVTPMVATGKAHTVGLKFDGTVVAVGYNKYGQCDVGGWTRIVQVAAGEYHTVGLGSDGTVVAVGSNLSGRCDVGGWTDITQVAAGDSHTVGLKSDRTVVAVGYNYSGECNVGNWTDIVQVAAGGSHTVGLKSDGTVVAVGYNYSGECNVGGWTDIIQVATGAAFTTGLKSDGTVVAVGNDHSGQCDVGGWTDMVQVAAGLGHTVGLKSDGTVATVGRNDHGQCDVGGWTDITQVAAREDHTVGYKDDGSVVAVGLNDYGQCDVGGWNLITGRPPINWPLFGGITGAVIAVGLVIFLVSRRRSFRTGFGGKIWGFLRRPAPTFRAVKDETLGSALRYALICLVIFGIVAAIIGVTLSRDDNPLLLSAQLIAASVGGGMLFIFIGGAWTNLCVYLLAGRRSHGYKRTVKALAYGGTPAYLIGWLLLLGMLAEDSFGPPILSSILTGLGALILIWALVVTTIGLGQLHGITKWRLVAISILAIVTAALVISVVATILYLVLGVWAILWWWARM